MPQAVTPQVDARTEEKLRPQYIGASAAADDVFVHILGGRLVEDFAERRRIKGIIVAAIKSRRLQMLENLLKSKGKGAHKRAALVLKTIVETDEVDRRAVLEMLVELLGGLSEVVQWAALFLLENVAKCDFRTLLTVQGSLERLVGLLGSNDEIVQEAAAGLLSHLSEFYLCAIAIAA
ncbi:hypothetical protein KFL_009290040, partial [Klebsormidium nitens]